MNNSFTDFQESFGESLEGWVTSGRPAGEYMDKFVSWKDNPEAFLASNEVIDQSTQAYIERRATTQEYRKEIDRIKDQRANRNTDRPGYFKIGTVELTIPPTQIAVSDIKQNYLHKTLRTSSDIVLQSGHSVKAIELDIFFHNIDDINNKLRPMLAQLKATPFVPIYSEYLRSLVCPGVTDIQSVDFNDKNYKNVIICNDAIEKNKNYIRESIRKNSKIMFKKPNLIPDLDLYWDGILGDNNPSGLDKNISLEENMKNMARDSWVAENKADPSSFMFVVHNASVAINELRNRKVNFVNKMQVPLGGKGVIAVLSQINISTASGFPESLVCHASFFVFNHMPFSPGFEFFTPDNGPTFDIDECTYFIQWYVNRFMKPSHDQNDKYFSEIPGTMNGKLTLTYNPLSLSSEENSNIDKLSINKDPVVLSTDNDSVCVSISVSQRNSIAFMPIISYPYPTCQYMGSNNSEILVTIDTIDEGFLDKINYITKIAEDFARAGGDKKRRLNWVDLDNEILSFCGIKRGVINSIETQTVEGVAGMNRIQMSIIEFNPRQFLNESLKGMAETNENMVMEYLKYDIQKYLNYRNQKGSPRPSQRIEDLLNNNNTYRDAILNAIMEERGAVAKGFNPATRSFGLNKLREAANIGKNSLASTDNLWNEVLGVASKTVTPVDSYDTSPAVERRAIDAMVPVLRGEITKKLEVSEIDSDYLLMLYNSDSFNTYKINAREVLRSFLGGEGDIISRDLADRLYKLGIWRDAMDKSITYPDLSLPTYSDTARVGEGVPKITYKNLGRRPLRAGSASPRQDGDRVEADFYFYFIPLSEISTKLNGKSQLNVEDLTRKSLAIFGEEFEAMVADIVESSNFFGVKPSQKKGRDLDIDGLLDEKGSTYWDNVIKEAKSLAENLKSSIESTSTTKTSPESNLAFSMADSYNSYIHESKGILYDFFTYPGIREYLKDNPSRKQYSGKTQDAVDDDSGRNIYGGLMRDASWFTARDSQKTPSMVPAPPPKVAPAPREIVPEDIDMKKVEESIVSIEKALPDIIGVGIPVGAIIKPMVGGPI